MTGETTITVVGNLCDDLDLRYTKDGVALGKVNVAATPRFRDRDTGEYKDGEPLFLTCTLWRELAEHAAESLRKGARVIVTGRLRLSRWETKDGEKRSAYGLDVDEIGPSLRFATATVRKLNRRTGPTAPDDPWQTASPNPPTPDVDGDAFSMPAQPASLRVVGGAS